MPKMPLDKSNSEFRAPVTHEKNSRKRPKIAHQSTTSQPNAQNLNLRLGIEIECLPEFNRGRKDKSIVAREKRYTIIANEMQQYLKDNPKIMVYDEEDKQTSEHKVWSLKYDPSLNGKSHHDNTCPVEVISPVLVDNFEHAGEKWKPMVERIFQALNQRGDISTNSTCGTHIHLSPESGGWSLENLRKLSCCVLYFERAFEVLYPEATKDHHFSDQEWRENYAENTRKIKRAIHAKANRTDNYRFSDMYKDNVDLIYETRKIDDDLISLMNPINKKYKNCPTFDRAFAWNFTNLLSTKSGTIEYRRPPGVQGANACINWVRLAIAFVRAAIQVDDPVFPLDNSQQKDSTEMQYVDVGLLKKFLETGLPPGHTMESYFGSFFEGKKANLEVIPVKDRYTEVDFEGDDFEGDADDTARH